MKTSTWVMLAPLYQIDWPDIEKRRPQAVPG
jgi:hypothetical protein